MGPSCVPIFAAMCREVSRSRSRVGVRRRAVAGARRTTALKQLMKPAPNGRPAKRCTMKASSGTAPTTCAWAHVPDRRPPIPATHRQGHDDRNLRLRPALFDGLHSNDEAGDILGHEFMGEVVDVGKENHAPGGRPGRRRLPSPAGVVSLRAAVVVALRQLELMRITSKRVRICRCGSVRLLA